VFDVLKAFVNDFTVMEYITFLVGILTTLVGLFLYTKNHLKTEKDEIIDRHLINDETINSYVQRLETKTQHHPSLYKTLLHNVLNRLSNLLGELKIFSLQGFDKHLNYSVIYSLFFFYLIWLFGGSGIIGTHELLPNNTRITITLFLLFVIVCVYPIAKYEQEIILFLRKKIPTLSHISNAWIETLFWAIAIGLIVVVGIGIGIGGVVRGVAIGLIVVVGRGGGLLGVIGLVIIGVGSINSGIISYLLFFLFLPFINAIFDYISMYFSRFFAQQILKTNSKLKIFVDALLDLIIAIILLYLLAETLYFVLNLANVYLIKDETMFIPIDPYKEQILLNPFHQDILWITFMLISTLIPTILHMFLATYALLAYFVTKPHLHELVTKLNDLKPNDPNYLKKEEVAEGLVRYRLSGMIKLYLMVGTLLVSLFVVVLVMLFLKKGLYFA
jgi:hypothetical protein